jgi:energy-coupling factor transport system permease protein
MVVAITLRFLPMLALEAEHLVKAQVSRGANFGKGRMGPFKRLFRMFPLLLPLFITSLRRGENLALAMEARGYTDGRGRTQLIRFHSGPADVVALIAVCAAAGTVLAIHFGGLDELIWSHIRQGGTYG